MIIYVTRILMSYLFFKVFKYIANNIAYLFSFKVIAKYRILHRYLDPQVICKFKIKVNLTSKERLKIIDI